MSSISLPVGIAILGAGLFAKGAHLPAIANLRSLAVLRAVYSRSNKSASEFAKEAEEALGLSDLGVYSDETAGLDELLARSDIQAVIVVLPITTQPAIVLKCLTAGKHVLSEKPVAPSVSDGIALIHEYERSHKPKKLLWRVSENFEVEPGYIASGAAIRAGKIGNVIGFNSTTVNRLDQTSKWYKTPWRTVPDYQGGFLLDGGVHSAASLRVVLPSPITHLTGFATLNKKYLAPHDTIYSVMKTADGTTGAFEMTFASPTGTLGDKKNSIIVTGESGWAEIGGAKNDKGEGVIRTTIHRQVGKEGEDKEEVEVSEEPSCGVEKAIEYFLSAVTGKEDKGYGEPREALKDVAIIQAGLTSNGALIDLAKMT